MVCPRNDVMTIFSATRRCNTAVTLFRIVLTLFQCCDAVLRWKSSLRIITLRKERRNSIRTSLRHDQSEVHIRSGQCYVISMEFLCSLLRRLLREIQLRRRKKTYALFSVNNMTKLTYKTRRKLIHILVSKKWIVICLMSRIQFIIFNCEICKNNVMSITSLISCITFHQEVCFVILWPRNPYKNTVPPF